MKFLQSLAFKRTTAIGFYLLILSGSSVPGQNIPHVFKLTPDKLIHCAEYFVLSVLMTRWLVSEYDYSRKILFYVLLIGAFCGMTDELYQDLIPNRTPDFFDWCLDFVGTVLGITAFVLFRKNREQI
ncbi:hypothetical protein WSM22_24200 [Cytophagales bacterium WSM2-2]|nr:hypothetical protein WSM22_24200 [Cytophagales bacterium WSM2-2]